MSFRINSFDFANKTICLSKKTTISNDHTFTIITGKNAVGKSRLLTSIVTHYLRNSDSHSLFSEVIPERIIAISNINNDKFPLKRDKTEKYAYIGNKSIAPHMGLRNEKYFIFKNLYTNLNLNSESLISTFSYLGFAPTIKFKFNIIITSFQMKNESFTYFEILQKYNKHFSDNFEFFSKPFVEIIKLCNKDYNIKFESNSFEYKQLNKKIESITLDEKFFLYLLSKIYQREKKLNSNKYKYSFDIIFIKKIREKIREIYFNLNPENHYIRQDIIFLLNLNFIRIQEVYLLKKNEYQQNTNQSLELNFNDISSGQQSLFNIFCGISSVISNNSLICIDEPEVNLHPSWQTEFILKLQSFFKNYHGCHFIIATHSPQIVSGLKSESGYVVDLENNLTFDAKDYSNRSADFQLAKIFNSPGYNNEYILKICFHLLSLIKEGEKPTLNDLISLKEIDIFKDNLKDDDPSLYLIKQVQSFFE